LPWSSNLRTLIGASLTSEIGTRTSRCLRVALRGVHFLSRIPRRWRMSPSGSVSILWGDPVGESGGRGGRDQTAHEPRPNAKGNSRATQRQGGTGCQRPQSGQGRSLRLVTGFPTGRRSNMLKP
jgi:hypothetical protein